MVNKLLVVCAFIITVRLFVPFLLSYTNLIIHGCIEIETQFAYIPDGMSTRLLSLFMLQWTRYVHESMTRTFVFVITFAQLAQIVNYSIHYVVDFDTVNYSDQDHLNTRINYPPKQAKEIHNCITNASKNRVLIS